MCPRVACYMGLALPSRRGPVKFSVTGPFSSGWNCCVRCFDRRRLQNCRHAAVYQDQGAFHDVVQLAGISKERSSSGLPPTTRWLRSTWERKFQREKNSPVKVSLLAAKGEKGENFPPAKISRYTVQYLGIGFLLQQPQCGCSQCWDIGGSGHWTDEYCSYEPGQLL